MLWESWAEAVTKCSIGKTLFPTFWQTHTDWQALYYLYRWPVSMSGDQCPLSSDVQGQTPRSCHRPMSARQQTNSGSGGSGQWLSVTGDAAWWPANIYTIVTGTHTQYFIENVKESWHHCLKYCLTRQLQSLQTAQSKLWMFQLKQLCKRMKKFKWEVNDDTWGREWQETLLRWTVKAFTCNRGCWGFDRRVTMRHPGWCFDKSHNPCPARERPTSKGPPPGWRRVLCNWDNSAN